ncbi:low molecular weight phosphotyrosine protein phosphatase [Streptococcus chenjunshii]|uniref:protein-tyrosine-phosphatase n=1 Tax=Streptococcus chenjunshii TaxID=2173853 RepID=A0A372KKM5_9STRE|nr:low molecular weight protein-tyrosine-phosphatase [Streptococcus chenjunshii]AXQ77661.1 low molecular weight phosphotyrosine protein phosphatase [Streptococcus chenjunshii]RFU50644.1 low molecular weight phosphotyrosine protein phosphatase [Streptococcus chenjunshii]RFU52817.1 low molecular weight phosphotyrosine protein phosphatase [Streptococcus chenjunshii]
MKKICFVCLGNICRSPMAEFVMKDMAKGQPVLVESRGTSGWEHGNPIHSGTQTVLKQHRIVFDKTKVSQRISLKDFTDFDYLIGMDKDNVRDLKRLSDGRFTEKIFLFTENGVPDPWYTGDFAATYDLVKQGCRYWLSVLSEKAEN